MNDGARLRGGRLGRSSLSRRRRSLTGRWHTATVYAITSSPGWQAEPALLASWIQGHWTIEVRREVALV